MKKKTIIFIFLTTIIYSSVFSQIPIEYADKVYDENIATVVLKVKNKPLAYPVIKLNSNERLILEFDNFTEETKTYSYTYIHCTPDWEKSDMMQAEYIDGFPSDLIENYEFSFNTLNNYNHYKLEFPSELCRPTLSGNYILFVYKDDDKEKPLLTVRFRMVEHGAFITAELRRSTYLKKSETCTQFTTRVKMQNNEFGNYFANGMLYILRNNDDNFALHATTPDYVKGNILEYNNPMKYSLEGGNEFRYINLKDRQVTTDKVAAITFISPYYVFTAYPEIATPHLYAQGQDVNGKFIITAEGTDYPENEAEYVLVDFTFVTKKPFAQGDVYLYGDFTNKQILPENKMEYLPKYGAYNIRKRLKQGFYNYWYVLYEPSSGELSLSATEGNFHEAENDYVFYFYFQKPGEIYHRLLGFEVFNSQKQYNTPVQKN